MPQPPARGTSTNLTGTPAQTRDKDFSVFAVEPGEPLLLRLIFVSLHERPAEFRVLMLLNYRQAAFGWQEVPPLVEDPYLEPYPALETWEPTTPTNNVVEFAALLEEPRWFHLWTEPLEPGYYDLALLIVPDFRLDASETGYSTTYRTFLRGAVYVGPAVPPTVTYPVLDPFARPREQEGGDSLLIQTAPYGQQMWSSTMATPGGTVTLNANWVPTVFNLPENQLPESPLPTAFVGFIEDQQVPINGEFVIYGSGVPNTVNFLPISITAPTAPGRYQFFLQQFPNPYVDPAYAYETGREFYAESSQRFSLHVEAGDSAARTPDSGQNSPRTQS